MPTGLVVCCCQHTARLTRNVSFANEIAYSFFSHFPRNPFPPLLVFDALVVDFVASWHPRYSKRYNFRLRSVIFDYVPFKNMSEPFEKTEEKNVLGFFSSSEILFLPRISDCPTSEIRGTSDNSHACYCLLSCQDNSTLISLPLPNHCDL